MDVYYTLYKVSGKKADIFLSNKQFKTNKQKMKIEMNRKISLLATHPFLSIFLQKRKKFEEYKINFDDSELLIKHNFFFTAIKAIK